MKAAFRKGLVLLLSLVLVTVIAAQDGDAPAGFGEGAPIVEPNFGSDVATLNPIIVTDGTSTTAINRMFPFFIGYSPDTLGWEPGAINGLATDWTISDDGLVYTFTLRDDWVWSDGVPVTSADIVWFFEAVENEDTETPLTTMRDAVASVVAIDDYTVEITFEEVSCTSLDDLNGSYAVPAHIFEDIFGDDYAAMGDSEFNLNMPVTSGDFVFENYRPGEQVTALANPNYPDSIYGAVIPEGWVYKTVTDQVVQMEQFYAGELTWVRGVPQAFEAEVEERAAAGEFQTFRAPSTGIRFLAFNTADPENPVNGLDEDGNPVEQGNHPVLGDVRVRQALAYTVDFDSINDGVFFGSGVEIPSHVLPTSWANPTDLEPYPFEPDTARQLLDEAGWIDEDGDGIRECVDCLYAEAGTPLSFRLETNAGNVSQEALYTILQDAWLEIGVDAQFAAVDFNTLVEDLTAQTFDAIGLFWGFSVPDNPDDTSATFDPSADIVGSGFNASSYYNERVSELLEQARTLPGCDQAERAELYGEVYEILQAEVPWLWLGSSTVLTAAQTDVENWDPKAGYATWNMNGWYSESP